VRVAFLGLGIMGRGMAANLLRAGFQLTVYNRTPERARALAEQGAVVADSPAAAARDADIVGMCVTDGTAVEQLAQAILPVLRPGKYVVDHSTISPEQTRRLAQATAATGAEWLDAPVTGGDRGAAAGTLTIMVGGSADGFAAIRPYLQAMGKKIVHVGGSGQGQLVKLVNNFIGAVALAGAAEGLLLGLRGGVSLATMMEVLSAGSAQSVSLQLLAERLAKADYRPGFSLSNRLKDMDLALEAARQLRAALPVGALVAELFRERLAQGEGDLDQTVLARRYLGALDRPVE
jgi:3-hydroxyisobutyrate dehydrogenase-like beta-hydroxyacid dehydrogenase